MSNRRRPNSEPGKVWRTGLSDGDTLALAVHLALTTKCPDCQSETSVDRDGRVVHVRVAHDPGCPFIAGVTR